MNTGCRSSYNNFDTLFKHSDKPWNQTPQFGVIISVHAYGHSDSINNLVLCHGWTQQSTMDGLLDNVGGYNEQKQKNIGRFFKR